MDYPKSILISWYALVVQRICSSASSHLVKTWKHTVYRVLDNERWTLGHSLTRQRINQIRSFILLAKYAKACNVMVGPSLRHCTWQHSSFWRNFAVVLSHWQPCVRFDWLEIWTSDLLLQRRTCYCSTNQPVQSKNVKIILHCIYYQPAVG